MNGATWLVLAALALCAGLAVRSLRRGGGSCGSCSGDCANCQRGKKRK